MTGNFEFMSYSTCSSFFPEESMVEILIITCKFERVTSFKMKVVAENRVRVLFFKKISSQKKIPPGAVSRFIVEHSHKLMEEFDCVGEPASDAGYDEATGGSRICMFPCSL